MAARRSRKGLGRRGFFFFFLVFSWIMGAGCEIGNAATSRVWAHTERSSP